MIASINQTDTGYSVAIDGTTVGSHATLPDAVEALRNMGTEPDQNVHYASVSGNTSIHRLRELG